MLFFNDKSKSLNIFFLKEEHLALLRAKGIPFSDLRNLLYYNVSREDLLNWISFQRSMEMKLFGRKITRYTESGDLKFADRKPSHDMTLLTPLLEQVYQEVKYYDDNAFSSYSEYDGTIVVLLKNDTVLERGFKAGQGSILKTIYHAVLITLGYHQTYFREPVRDKDQEGITLPELIAKLTA